MARIMMQGTSAQVELTTDPVEGGVIATCTTEDCPWSETYDDWNDATEYAADHADHGSCPGRGWQPERG